MGETARAKSFFSAQIKYLHMLSFDDAMERIAGAVPMCMLHLFWTCVVDQHYTRSALAGDKSLQAMTMSIQDDLYPSSFDYHLPDSLATACELGHDLHYLKELDPNDVFITEQVLRRNFDPRIDPYSDGNHNYNNDCHFLDALEVHALFENDSRAFSDPALDSADDDSWGPLKGSKSRETDFL